MKQHMLTHKIRDMPPHLFEQKQGGSSETGSCHDVNATPSCQPCQQQPPQQPQKQQQPIQQQQHTPQPQPIAALQHPLQPLTLPQQQPPEIEPPKSASPQQKIELGVKRSPPQGDTNAMPLPKRQPSKFELSP